jgi:hypothetical protein
MHFLGTYCPMLADYSWTNISIVLFTNHKVSKFIKFTNIWNNFVCLFVKSELVRGQSPPAFIILFLRNFLCFLNSSHSHSKWSVVCGPTLQTQFGSSVILNLWYYDLSVLWSVIIVDRFMPICKEWFSLLPWIQSHTVITTSYCIRCHRGKQMMWKYNIC